MKTDPTHLDKRDAACCPDQLAIPINTGGTRPRLDARDISRFTDMSFQELRGYWSGEGDIAGDSGLRPFFIDLAADGVRLEICPGAAHAASPVLCGQA